jgi:hypothetical protein
VQLDIALQRTQRSLRGWHERRWILIFKHCDSQALQLFVFTHVKSLFYELPFALFCRWLLLLLPDFTALAILWQKRRNGDAGRESDNSATSISKHVLLTDY